jgi:hypothetical protein
MLEPNTKASTRVAYVMNDAFPTRQGIPMRLTVQSEREAPILTLTDRAPIRDQESGDRNQINPPQNHRHCEERSDVAIQPLLGSLLACRCNEGEPVTLPSIEATAHNLDNPLKAELGDLPQGSVLTDGSNTFTATKANSTADITNWQTARLTLTPPQACQAEFTLRVQVTQTRQNAKADESKALMTVAGLRVITQPVKPGEIFRPNDDLETEGAKTDDLITANPGASATVTFHSTLPKTPFAAKRQGQGGYIIVNHGPNAKPRPKSDQPVPKIDWNAKPDLEDFKITNPAWVAETFDRLKEKPKTLGEITGLVFSMEGKK